MATQTIKMKIQFRRDTTANWELYKDIVPAAGEPCFDIELGTLKIGDGIKTYEELKPIGGCEVSADGKSIVLEDGIFKLAGFDDAEVGAQPRVNADGNIEWVVPSTETVEGLQKVVAGLQSDVTNMQTTVSDLKEIVSPSGDGAVTLLERVESLEVKVGEDNVDEKIDAKINEFIAKVSDDGVVNTLKELVDYVADHDNVTADIVADITSLKNLVGETSVKDQIADAVDASEKKANVVLERVKYEVSSKPVGTLVDYRDKEIRVMVPADTQFVKQNSGENADADAYYIGLKAYAPDGAVNFKEDLAEIIADSTMYSFAGNDFAGTDAYGRKYSIVWLPVAKHSDGAWTYYGEKSNNSKYIGWHYSVEWYDVNGVMIDSDCIRINLSNEDCHNVIEPFYMANVVKNVSVNGTLLDMVDGKIDIAINNVIKSSDEIAVGEDGTLSIKQISFDKVMQEDDYEVVLNGGGAAG